MPAEAAAAAEAEGVQDHPAKRFLDEKLFGTADHDILLSACTSDGLAGSAPGS